MLAENCHPCINVAFAVTGTFHGSELLLLLHPSTCVFSFCDKSKCLLYNELSYSGYVKVSDEYTLGTFKTAGCVWYNWFPALEYLSVNIPLDQTQPIITAGISKYQVNQTENQEIN